MEISFAPVVSPADLPQLLRHHPSVRLLDVRTPGEYESAHIPGAYNVPLDTLGEHGSELRGALASPVVLVCQSGQRARKAEDALRRAGMPNLHVLDGGINGWIAAGNAVVRGKARLSLERQVRIAAGALSAAGALLALAVNPLFAVLPAAVGSGLVFAGITDRCGLGMMLAKLPYNRPVTCDVSAMVQALVSGSAPARVGRGGAAAAASAQPCA